MADGVLVYGTECRAYNFGPEHPFTPIRGTMLIDLLEHLGADEYIIESERASRSEIRRMHSETYVAMVEAASSGNAPRKAANYGLGTTDVPVFSGMHQATLWVVGGTLTAARQVASGTVRRALHLAGGLHHAHREAASGFCVYNDPSIAISELLLSGFDRIVYLDIDAHHGDGVQELFYEDSRVLTISLHESGDYLFPGSGFPRETGRGPGRGYAANFPLEPNTGPNGYLEVFDQFVPPLIAEFEPSVMVVECGADAHAMDPLAHLNLSSHTFEALFLRIIELADTYCNGQMVMHLGGGYNLDVTARIWAMLSLLLLGLEVPMHLPNSWLDRWQSRLNRTLTPTLHDRQHKLPLDKSIQTRNLRSAGSTMQYLNWNFL